MIYCTTVSSTRGITGLSPEYLSDNQNLLKEYLCHTGSSRRNIMLIPLQWRHNGCDGVSNHQSHHCLLNRLFRRADQRKHQGSAPLAFVQGMVNSPHKGPVTRKMFPFDDVIMSSHQGDICATGGSQQCFRSGHITFHGLFYLHAVIS